MRNNTMPVAKFTGAMAQLAATLMAVLAGLLGALKDFATDDNGVPLAASPDARGQVGTVITIVTIGIVAIIGILIYSQVNTALPSPDNSELNNSSTSVTEGFGSAMQLIPVVLIVLVASLVIAVVQRFGG